MKLLEIKKDEICLSVLEFDDDEEIFLHICNPIASLSIPLDFKDLKKLQKELDKIIYDYYQPTEYQTDYDA